MWILFDGGGNEHLLRRFYEREKGKNNRLTLNADKSCELISVCKQMLNEQSKAARYSGIFKILELVDSGTTKSDTNTRLSPEIAEALDTVNENLTCFVAVSELARAAHMRLNTFERHFRTNVGMPPCEYIRRRLSLAASMLCEGCSVHEACDKCGFSDYSHFIAIFKKQFSVTPLQYKKRFL